MQLQKFNTLTAKNFIKLNKIWLEEDYQKKEGSRKEVEEELEGNNVQAINELIRGAKI